MDIEGSGALVVGGASGLGEATARRLHAQGAALTIADVNAEKGQALADELGRRLRGLRRARGGPGRRRRCEAAAEADGGLRICICCAGTGFAQKIAGSRGPHALEPFAVIIAINLIGTFNVLRFASNADAGQRAARGRRARRVREHRVDRRLRRPGRPGRLQRLEGRRGRHDAARRRATCRGGHPRVHHRPRPLRHAAAGHAARRRRATRWASRSPSRRGSGCRPSTRRWRRTSSRTGCSTARSSGSTARCGWRRARRLSSAAPGTSRSRGPRARSRRGSRAGRWSRRGAGPGRDPAAGRAAPSPRSGGSRRRRGGRR